MRLLFQTRAHSALDRAEDPVQTLDYAYGQQQAMLREVTRGLVDVATAKEQLKQQASRLHTRVPELDEQARQAMTGGREDLARLALERKQFAIAELRALEQQIAEITEEEHRLASGQRRLAAQVEQFRVHRTVLTAQHSAAAAQFRVHETLSGVGGDVAELGIAVGRAEERIERMRSRAVAIDALMASVSVGSTGVGGDALERELREMAVRRAVDDELASLRSDVQGSDAPDTAPTDADDQGQGAER